MGRREIRRQEESRGRENRGQEIAERNTFISMARRDQK